MKKLLYVGLLLATAWMASANQTVSGKMEGRVLTAGSRRILILGQDGRVVWEHKTENLPHDVWRLPGGNILYADEATVSEVTPEHKVVFEYRPAPAKGGGAFTCQRLPNGNTLVGENSTGRVLEVDRLGKVVFTLHTAPFKPGDHQNMRMARKLANGHYLVCHSGARVVKEYTAEGRVTAEFKVDNLAFSAVRTPRGATLVGAIDKIVEFDSAGKVAWEFRNTGVPGVTIGSICGIDLLPGGNIAAGCYRAYDPRGRGVGLFEITRGKKLVWSYADPRGSDGTMMPIQVLTPDGQKAIDGGLR